MVAGAEADPTVTFQSWLDRGTDLIMAGDFDAWAGTVELPLMIVTASVRTVVADEAALRAGFVTWRATMAGNGATTMVRIASDTRQPSADSLAGRFEVHLLASGARTAPAFTSWALLRRSAGVWRLSHLVSGLANRRYPFSVLRVDPDAVLSARGPRGGTPGGTPGSRGGPAGGPPGRRLH